MNASTITSILTLSALAIAPLASAQEADSDSTPEIETNRKDKSGYHNMIIIGPRFVPPGLALRYDRMLGDRVSLILGAGFGALRSGDASLTRIEAQLGADFLPLSNGFAGLYLGPRLRLNSWNINAVESEDGDTANGSVLVMGAGAVAGYRWVWHPGFSLGLGLGGQYLAVLNDVEATDENGDSVDTGGVNFSGFFPVIDITLGWAF